VSADQYFRELRRYCLALAMLRHGVRPSTVRHWTGLSRQRTRQVVRSYNENRSAGEPRCDPGPPPTALKKLLKDPQLRAELTAAAGLCRVLKILSDSAKALPPEVIRTIEMGENLCHAFEIYRRLVPNARMTLEHLIVLVLSLAEQEHWALERCTCCESFLIIDPLSLERRLCGECRDRPRAEPAVPEDSDPEGTGALQTPVDQGLQQRLF
jgi:hypothetical protein